MFLYGRDDRTDRAIVVWVESSRTPAFIVPTDVAAFASIVRAQTPIIADRDTISTLRALSPL